MKICLSAIFAFVFLGLPDSAAAATAVQRPSAPAVRVRSIVRADARTGRLVRSVVVYTPPPPRLTEEQSASLPKDSSIIDMVESAATTYQVDPALVHALIDVESAGNRYAVSHKGAQGLMQLMPATARRFGVRDSFDVGQNIQGGVRYLAYLQSIFSDVRLAIAAYNAGEGAVWKYKNTVPPYRETEQYVAKVQKRYGARAVARKRKAEEASAVAAAAEVPAGPRYSPVEYYVDDGGRLHLRTVPPSDTPGAQAGVR